MGSPDLDYPKDPIGNCSYRRHLRGVGIKELWRRRKRQ